MPVKQKHIFLVAGELSGDRIAGWYLAKRQVAGEQFMATGVGGSYAQAAGMVLQDHYNKLNVIGIIEIIKHIPRLLRYMHDLVEHIMACAYDEVVLIDFPGFNLRLAGQLKRRNSALKITYVSPPQLWVWGAWRSKKLKKYSDDVIVIYPFEVVWYRERGVTARWLGSPVYDALVPLLDNLPQKQRHIALMPGSRSSEIAVLLPLFLRVAQELLLRHPTYKFILPVAQSVDQAELAQLAERCGLLNIFRQVTLVPDTQEKYQELAACCVALTKPGTVTLELGLLRVPTIIAFKTSWLSYRLGKLVVSVSSMGLPNLLLSRPIFPEFIQDACTVERLVMALDGVIMQYETDAGAYAARVGGLDVLAGVLCPAYGRQNIPLVLRSP